MTPLSMEKESVGRPAMFHARILMASPRVLLRLKSVEQFTLKDCSGGGKEREGLKFAWVVGRREKG